jgi:predicted nuclease of restriction endonuclease-like (RecB) superfamily
MSKEISKQTDFENIYNLIAHAQTKVWQHVNNTLINLYWNIGQYVNNKIENGSWGQAVVQELSKYILAKNPMTKGFSARNIWRMKQFYETYKDYKSSMLLTKISWSNHLHILSKTKTLQEKEFYLKIAAKTPYPARDFARLIDSSAFERTMLADQKLPTALTEFPVNTKGVFKDSYVFEFLDIPNDYKEKDLRQALLKQQNPSIGILICKNKDEEIVKYALNRNMSPTMTAEYETKLIDKKLLQNKLRQITIAMKSNNELDEPRRAYARGITST